MIGYYLGVENESKARYHLSKVEKNVDILLKKNPLWADIYALKGALYGFKIALSKFKAISLGMKSIDYIEKSLEMNNSCINCHVERGNQLFYTPGFVGGDKKKALKHYEKAVDLFKSNPVYKRNNWFYLTTMTVLAQGYEELKEYDEAKRVYREILAYEPDYKWVKEELYPGLLKKM